MSPVAALSHRNVVVVTFMVATAIMRKMVMPVGLTILAMMPACFSGRR
jgi:hypothetical protein